MLQTVVVRLGKRFGQSSGVFLQQDSEVVVRKRLLKVSEGCSSKFGDSSWKVFEIEGCGFRKRLGRLRVGWGQVYRVGFKDSRLLGGSEGFPSRCGLSSVEDGLCKDKTVKACQLGVRTKRVMFRTHMSCYIEIVFPPLLPFDRSSGGLE